MRLIEKTYTRILVLACFLLARLPLWAQDVEEGEDEEGPESGGRVYQYDVEDFSFLNITLFDILLIVFLLVTTFLLARIKKQLAYIFLCLAALAYYFSKQ